MSNPLAPGWLKEPEDPNQLHSGVWPSSARRDSHGVLSIGGVSTDELIAQYGSPLYVLDKFDFVSRAIAAREAVEIECEKHGVEGRVYYASKAFLSADIVSWVCGAGLGLDVSSAGEMAIAIAGGADPSVLEFQGNNKSEDELAQAMSVGVEYIVIDAEIEADRIQKIAQGMDARQKVMIRVNSGVHAETHEYLATAREDQKFGVSLQEVLDLASKVQESSNLKLVGLHSHIGSQIFRLEPFLEAARIMLELYEQLSFDEERLTLNLGGGFGISYTGADQPEQLSDMLKEIVNYVALASSERGIPMPNLAFEPGRAIAGPPGVTLYSVGISKPVNVTLDREDAVRTYLSVDGGMSDNLRPALYGANYSARIASRLSEQGPKLVRVVGKHCESGDIVVDAEYLPGDVGPGDILAVAATGAYCHSLGSNYNFLGRPPVVAVSQGKSVLMVARESLDDIFARDQGLLRARAFVHD